jgi:hypothetical protein
MHEQDKWGYCSWYYSEPVSLGLKACGPCSHSACQGFIVMCAELETVFTMDETKRIKLCGIPSHQKLQNSADFDKFRNTEFRVIPRNSGQFRILYGIYGI